MNMLADVVIGKMFGELGRTILRMLFQGLGIMCRNHCGSSRGSVHFRVCRIHYDDSRYILADTGWSNRSILCI